MSDENIIDWLRSTSGLGASHPALGGYTWRHGEAADEIERLTDEVERLREARKEPIHIGVGKVLVGLAYDEGDPLKIEREVVIHQIDRTVPVGDEVPELANSSTDDLDVLARIRIDDPSGSWLLMEKLEQAIENARRALDGEE